MQPSRLRAYFASPVGRYLSRLSTTAAVSALGVMGVTTIAEATNSGGTVTAAAGAAFISGVCHLGTPTVDMATAMSAEIIGATIGAGAVVGGEVYPIAAAAISGVVWVV